MNRQKREALIWINLFMKTYNHNFRCLLQESVEEKKQNKICFSRCCDQRHFSSLKNPNPNPKMATLRHPSEHLNFSLKKVSFASLHFICRLNVYRQRFKEYMDIWQLFHTCNIFLLYSSTAWISSINSIPAVNPSIKQQVAMLLRKKKPGKLFSFLFEAIHMRNT